MHSQPTQPGGPPPPRGAGGANPGAWIGPYRVDGELARGGMGVVYRAFHTQLGRPVAIKVQRAGAPAAETERFRIEAQAAARLRHPNIAGIHEVGALHDGQPFLVMDLIQGGSLKGLLEQEGPLPLDRAAEVMAALARAVGFAHAHNILHRDIKPANVLLNPEGQPVLTDFGLAKQVGAASGVTVTGQVMGTPSYMPPEQADGDSERIDRRADVYSLGATLYALLTGEAPFKGESAIQVIAAVVSKPPVPPSKLRPEVDRDLETICLQCLEKEPEQRYPTANALAEDLERYLAGEPIEARPVGPLERLWRRARRRPSLVAGFAVALLLLIGGLGAGLVVTLRALEDAREAGRKERLALAEEAKQKQRAQDERERAEREEAYARAQAQLERGYALLGRRRNALAARSFAAAAERLTGRKEPRADRLRAVAARGAAEAIQRRGLLPARIPNVTVPRFLPGDEERVLFAGKERLELFAIDRDGRPRSLARATKVPVEIYEAAISPQGRVLLVGHKGAKGASLPKGGVLQAFDLPSLRFRFGFSPSGTERSAHVMSISVRPDGREAMASHEPGLVTRFELSQGRILKTISSADRPHARYVTNTISCGYSPDGNLLVVGYRDGTVSVWDVNGRHAWWKNLRGDGPRLAAVLRPGSFGEGKISFLLAGEEKGRVQAIRPDRPGAAKTLMDGSEGAVTGADLLRGDADEPDWLALWTADGTLRVLTAPGGAEVARFRLPSTNRTHCSLSPRRSLLAVATAAHEGAFFDLRRVQTFHGGGPVAIDRAGRRFARARPTSDGTPAPVEVWDLVERRRLARLQLTRAGEEVRSLALSPDGKLLAAGVMPWHPSGGDGWDPNLVVDGKRGNYDNDAGAVVVVDLTTRARRRVAVDQPYALSLAGGALIVGCRNDLGGSARPRGRVTVQPLDAGPAKHLSWHLMSVHGLARAPDGRLASGAEDGTVAIWADDGRPAQVLDLRTEAALPEAVPRLEGETRPLRHKPDAALLKRHLDRFMKLTRRPNRLQPVYSARRLRDTWGVRGLAFGPRGRRLVTGTGDARVRVWDLTTGTVEVVLEVDHAVLCCGFLSDGRLALATRGGVVQVWELGLDAALTAGTQERRGGHLLRSVHTGSRITHAALGGDTLVAACEDSTVWAWDLRTPPLAGFPADPQGVIKNLLKGE